MDEWKRIKAEYLAGGTSYRKLCEKHGCKLSELRNVAEKEKWVELKTQAQHKSNTKIIEILSDKSADKLSRVLDITDKLLDKLEQAVAELDVQLYKKVEKIKEIEYNNDLRPDKPTKEIIHESEEVIEAKTIIDRSGLKAIASSLKDIKEIQMLKSELDKQEQEARIAKLQREAEDEVKETEVKVTFEGDLGLYSK